MQGSIRKALFAGQDLSPRPIPTCQTSTSEAEQTFARFFSAFSYFYEILRERGTLFEPPEHGLASGLGRPGTLPGMPFAALIRRFYGLCYASLYWTYPETCRALNAASSLG
jgi:hypothetical protein